MTQQQGRQTTAEMLLSIKRQLSTLAQLGVKGLNQVIGAIDDLVVENATPEELDELLAEHTSSAGLDRLLAGRPDKDVA